MPERVVQAIFKHVFHFDIFPRQSLALQQTVVFKGVQGVEMLFWGVCSEPWQFLKFAYWKVLAWQLVLHFEKKKKGFDMEINKSYISLGQILVLCVCVCFFLSKLNKDRLNCQFWQILIWGKSHLIVEGTDRKSHLMKRSWGESFRGWGESFS